MNGGLPEFVNSIKYARLQELELPSIMASLDICEDEVESAPTISQEHINNVYIMKKRQSPARNCKRRCQLKPTKLNMSLPSDDSNYYGNKSNYYMNQSKCKQFKCLETIYEEPVMLKNGYLKHTGIGKQRKIQFNGITKAKTKHRRSKLKKINSCRVRKQRKTNMDEFIARFHELMGTEEIVKTVGATDIAVNKESSLS